MLRLTKKEQVLEERLESVCRENTELRASLASVHARLALRDQLEQQHSQQVRLLIGWPTCGGTYSANPNPNTSVLFGVCVTERASITKAFPAPGPVAEVSAGLWRAKPNNHLIPAIVTFTRKAGFLSCWFSFELSESGIWHVRIVSLWVLEWILLCFDCLVATFEETHEITPLSCCHISG